MTVLKKSFRVGLNPYGLTYTLGLQGQGTPRANPKGRGLEGFFDIAEELGARTLEIFDPWLRELSDDELVRWRDRLNQAGMVPIVSWGLMMGPFESAMRSAEALGAKTIRCGLTNVLCGDRGDLGGEWFELVASVRKSLADYGPKAADAGRVLAIENHQDFGSDELVAFCEETRGVGICYDTGNSFPVAEAPIDFTRRVAPHVRHIHLKDYRVQFTDEGYALVRCAIGDGAVPLAEILPMLARPGEVMTAVLEPGALLGRHVRLLTPGWWDGYAEKSGDAIAACLKAARVNFIAENADAGTPWEKGHDGELEAYELAMIRKSAENMRGLGLI